MALSVQLSEAGETVGALKRYLCETCGFPTALTSHVLQKGWVATATLTQMEKNIGADEFLALFVKLGCWCMPGPHIIA